MDRPDIIAALCRVLLQHLIEHHERLLERIDFGRWDAEASQELGAIDEALTWLGCFDTSSLGVPRRRCG